MKKMISLLLVFVLLFALCGCLKKASAAAPTSAPLPSPAAARIEAMYKNKIGTVTRHASFHFC